MKNSRKILSALLSLLICFSMAVPEAVLAAAEQPAETPSTATEQEVLAEEDGSQAGSEAVDLPDETAAGTDNSEAAAAEADPEVLPADDQNEVIDDQTEDTAGSEDTEEVPVFDPDPYLQISVPELNAAGLINIPADVQLSEPKNSNGVLFTGTQAALTSERIRIDHVFDWSRNPLGRVRVDGISDKKINVTADFYLDDEETPFCSVPLGKNMGKKEWGKISDKTAALERRDISGTHNVSISFTIEGAEADADISILLRTIEFCEESIPVMYFNIDENYGTIAAMNSSYDHSDECYGNVDVRVPDGYTSEYSDKVFTDMSGLELEYIRGRGNSTWDADKKPYKVKFEKKQDFFGMGKNKHWILLANRYDNSLVRNRMTYWIGTQFGLEYTPQCVPVEVVMNGEYYGSYLLCEQIRVGSSRVDIDDLDDTPDAVDSPVITGGYLLSMNPDEDENAYSMISTRRDSFLIESPSFEKVENDTQKNYMQGYLQHVEDAIMGKDFKDSAGTGYSELLDVDAAAKYWWIQEFSENGDAYGSGSTYLYKKRDGKLFWGPLWDFDYVAWGDLEYNDPQPNNSFNYTSMSWFDKLRTDKNFADKLASEWNNSLDGIITDVIKEGGLLDQYREETRASYVYDHEKYGSYDSDCETYDQEIEQLRTWISRRQEWVRGNLELLSPQTFTVTFRIDGKETETRTLAEGSALEDFPEVPSRKGYIFIGWYDAFGDRISESDEVYQDMVLDAKYIAESKAKKASALYFSLNEDTFTVYSENLSEEDEELYMPSYTVVPEDAIDISVTWTSSDESIATVNEEGMVRPLKYGDVTITGTLATGKSNSYLLHIVDGTKEDSYNWGYDYLDLSKETLKIKKGSYAQIPFTYGPQPCVLMNSFTWFSLDDDIASVDENGVIKGENKGTTYILLSDFDNGLFAKCKVTVTSGLTKAQRIKAAKAKKAKITKAVALKSHKIKLKWKKVSGVTGYQIYCAKSKNGKFRKVATVKKASSTKWTSPHLIKGKTYYYKIRPYTRISGKTYYGKWSKTIHRKVR